MSENKVSVGLIPWGTRQKPASQNFNNEDLPKLPYLRLKDGSNIVRVVTPSANYYHIRYLPKDSKKNFGDRVRTAYPTYGQECPVLKDLKLTEKDIKERFMTVVIDRSDGQLKLFDMSVLVQEQVEGILLDKNEGKSPEKRVTPSDFDINIRFNSKSNKPTGFYNVVPRDSEALSEEDIQTINSAGGQEMLAKVLQRAVACPKPEFVRKRLMELGWDGVSAATPAQAKSEVGEDIAEPKEADYSFDRKNKAAAASA
jgi:hypothetical protein